MLGKCSTTELYSQPVFNFLFFFRDKILCDSGWLTTYNMTKDDRELLILLLLWIKCGITGEWATTHSLYGIREST